MTERQTGDKASSYSLSPLMIPNSALTFTSAVSKIEEVCDCDLVGVARYTHAQCDEIVIIVIQHDGGRNCFIL